MQAHAIRAVESILAKKESFEIDCPSLNVPNRKSVSGMKKLLPLKLSSNPPESNFFLSPESSHLSSFEAGEVLNPRPQSPNLDRVLNHEFGKQRPPSMSIRPEKHRDIPYYTESGSPLLGLPYYTDEDIRVDYGVPESETCNIHHNQTLNDENSDCGLEELAGPGDLREMTSMEERDFSRSSDMSFKCLGEPLFYDEAAWLGSSLNGWNQSKSDCLPHVLSQNMPSGYDFEDWLSDSTRSSYCDDEEDVLTRATLLAPAKAQVIDVHGSRFPSLSIKIPPRSSSLVRTDRPGTPDSGCKSRMTFREGRPITPDKSGSWTEKCATNRHSFTREFRPAYPRRRIDLAMPSPPMSQTAFTVNGISAGSVPVGRNLQAPTGGDAISSPNSKQNSVCEIILHLEKCIRDFPSTMLLPDTQCVAAMRAYLRGSRALSVDPSPTTIAQPTSQFSNGVDWRPPCGLDCSQVMTASNAAGAQHKRSSSMSKACPPPCNFQSHSHKLCSSRDIFTASFRNLQSVFPAAPNMQPIRNIIPRASESVIGAIYANILAYDFLTSVSSCYNLAHNLPFYTSTCQGVPSKAASTLGIPTTARLPRIINTREDAVIVRGANTAAVRNGLLQCIGHLLNDVGGDGDWCCVDHKGHFVDVTLVRALVEVVRGCEMRCFGYL